MSRQSKPEPFASEPQPDLFGVEPVPVYRPDPAKVRSRLHKILGEARAARTFPWEPTQLSLYRIIFPQMTRFLPDGEGARLRLEFEAELARLAITAARADPSPGLAALGRPLPQGPDCDPGQGER